MEAIARLKNMKGSPRKARLVADNVRGKDVYQALNILRYTHKASAPKFEKLLESAINNWETINEGLRAEDSDLYVKKIFVDGGPVLKRFQPAPFGRAYRIRKRSSHITIVIDSRQDVDAMMEPVGAAEIENIEE